MVDSLLFGAGAGTSRTTPLMLASTQFTSTPVINFSISADGDKVETEVKPAYDQPVPPKKQQRFIALYDYEAQRADEMSLRKGDLVLLLCRESERWWLGENLTGGSEERGYFPANYVTPLEDEKKKKMFRTRRLRHTPASPSTVAQKVETSNNQ